MRAGIFLKQGGTAEIGEKSVLDNIRKCILSRTFLRGYDSGLSMHTAADYWWIGSSYMYFVRNDRRVRNE